jgi:hypothetical protein
MFLRWTKYTDKAGNTRLYASFSHSVRNGKIVRHQSKGSLHILGLRQDHKHPLQTRRVLWARLDHALKKFRRLSQTERNNIERSFGAKVGRRPK